MVVIHFLFNSLVGLYLLIVLVTVILGWLIGFNVVNRHNNFVRALDQFCRAVTEPALRPIRRFLPNLGGIDISPIVLLIGVQALQIGVETYLLHPMCGGACAHLR